MQLFKILEIICEAALTTDSVHKDKSSLKDKLVQAVSILLFLGCGAYTVFYKNELRHIEFALCLIAVGIAVILTSTLSIFLYKLQILRQIAVVTFIMYFISTIFFFALATFFLLRS